MLRPKPTRIALTEDDLCYHIDSIFKRNCDLAKWHQQRESSGNSYDGDNDEDDPYYHSDSCTVSDSLFDSECDETQQPTSAGDTPGGQQEVDADNRDTDRNSRPHRRLSVRFASPEPEPSSPDSNSRAVVQSDKASSGRQQHLISPALNLALISNAGSMGVRGDDLISQHNCRNSRSLFLPATQHAQPSGFAFDASLENLLFSMTALPFRGPRHEAVVAKSGTPHLVNRLSHNICMSWNARSSLASEPSRPPSSELPEQQLIPWESVSPAKMRHTRRTASALAEKEALATGREPQDPDSSKVLISETEAQEGLAERAPNPGRKGVQILSPEDPEHQPKKSHSSTPIKTTLSGQPDKEPNDTIRLGHLNTDCRTTKLEPNLGSPIRQGIKDKLTDYRVQDNLGREENIAPINSVEEPFCDWPREDPFISAMFPEPHVRQYDATAQIRRGLQGYVAVPPRDGQSRPEKGVPGQLVHPTLADAAIFEEYVNRMIEELDRAP